MRFVFILFLSLSTLFAQSDKLSHIPPPKSIFIDLDEHTCNNDCLEQLLQNGQVFSFLAKYRTNNESQLLQTQYGIYSSLFRLGQRDTLAVRIAVLVPQKSIRRYAISTVNSISAYLLTKEHEFELKVFNSIDEDESSLLKAIDKIKQENFQYVIAPLTQTGADILVKNAKNLLIYIPTVHRLNYKEMDTNIIFGGIDYQAQIDALLAHTNQKIAIFSDGSELGFELNNMIKQRVPQIAYEEVVSTSKINFKQLLKTNKKLDESSVFLNTPLVKTSLLSSQFRVYERKPFSILSTQINYNPLLLTLTQYEDRENFFLANSIGKASMKLEETNTLFGHNISYDWVNYSTSLGIDYIYANYLNPSSTREFNEEIRDNQVIYNISIIKPDRYKFEKVLF
jgi:SRSO17 transposase